MCGTIFMNNLCIGTAQLGMDYGVANQTGMPDFDEATQIIKIALQYGVRYFDTAQAYGGSEITLGKALQKVMTSENVRLISKLHPDFIYSGIEQLSDSINQTLHNLQQPTLWGILTHRLSSVKDWGRYKHDVMSLGGAEKVKFIGASVYTPEEALFAVETEAIDIIQVPMNILDNRLLKNNFFEIAAKKKKKVFIRSVYLQGLLLMTDSEIRNKNMGWTLDYLALYRNFIKRHNLLSKSFALKAIKQMFPDAVVITGVEHHRQLIENIELLKATDIDQRVIDEWWSNLSVLPEKLLNPSMWGQNE
jgi:aryl-alcohol dehydrogenase-like predicted oxidoreductase